MAPGVSVDFSVSEGPGVAASFPAAIAAFAPPFSSRLEHARVRALLVDSLPDDLARAITLPDDGIDFTSLAAAVAGALQDRAGPCGLPVEVERDEGRARILLGFHDAQATLRALHAGLEIAGLLFARAFGGPDRRGDVAALVARTERVMRARQPDHIARSLMRAARKRGIPFYPVSPGSATWQFGQGSAGIHFFEAASERDSLTGARLTGDKFLCNQLVEALGLPGVSHRIVADAAAAVRAARELGFPVVVKPIDRGKARGVTANVASEAEVEAAFEQAHPHSPRGVLVERHVAGDDHRLAVFGGRFCWAVRRSPPRVVGDGRRSIAELIEAENRTRGDADVAAGFVTRIVPDDDLLAVLAKQGLGLHDRPAAARVVTLRSVANTATGGTIVDCSATIHPDNRELAEVIARGLRMDAVGIDFMTPDIAKSWRDVDCAVLEVNRTPGFSSDSRAEIILGAAFPIGQDGRVPSVVLIGDAANIGREVEEFIALTGFRVGFTDPVVTRIGGAERRLRTTDLPTRVRALVLDGGCDAVVVRTQVDELTRHGFPLDRCDLALIATDVPQALGRVVESCAERVVRVNVERFDEQLRREILAVLRRIEA
jgi:cyanophycin synthetase